MDTSTAWPGPAELGHLVRQAQSTDPTALDALLGLIRAPLLAFFARRFSADTAEDLAQLALIRLSHALQARRVEPDRADAYLATIARNLLRTAYRRHYRDRERYVPIGAAEWPELSTGSAQAAPVELSLEADELRHAVCLATATLLPPDLTQIINGLLRGDTPTEIARRLALHPTTVRTRLYRARALLRSELKAHVEAERAERTDTLTSSRGVADSLEALPRTSVRRFPP